MKHLSLLDPKQPRAGIAAHIHSTADVQTAEIGAGSRIWQYCVILPGASIGANCNICSHCLIENGATVGDNVTIKSGVQLWDGIEIHDDVFIGPNVTFTNDPYPRSKRHLQQYSKTVVETGASVGANATILPGLTIGRNALIGAGAVVTRSVPAHALVAGNPARIRGYLDGSTIGKNGSHPVVAATPPKVIGVTLHDLSVVHDMRGDMLPIEIDRQIPFPVKRLFYVTNVPSQHIRGEHAHKECHQFLVCLQGSVRVAVDNGSERGTFLLDSPSKGLHLSPMVWASQYKYSADAVLGVFASHPYDADDYIRDYESYVRACREQRSDRSPRSS